MNESDLQRCVIDALKLFGWRYTHFRPAKTERGWRTPLTGDKGFPDIVAVRDRVLFLELKSDTGRLSPEQVAWRDALQAAGAEYMTVRPADFDALISVLR